MALDDLDLLQARIFSEFRGIRYLARLPCLIYGYGWYYYYSHLLLNKKWHNVRTSKTAKTARRLHRTNTTNQYADDT